MNYFPWQDVDQSAHVEVSEDDAAMDAKDADDRKDGDDVGIEDPLMLSTTRALGCGSLSTSCKWLFRPTVA